MTLRIVIEGMSKSGKSTLATYIRDMLRITGIRAVLEDNDEEGSLPLDTFLRRLEEVRKGTLDLPFLNITTRTINKDFEDEDEDELDLEPKFFLRTKNADDPGVWFWINPMDSESMSEDNYEAQVQKPQIAEWTLSRITEYIKNQKDKTTRFKIIPEKE